MTMDPALFSFLQDVHASTQVHKKQTWCISFDEGQFLHLLVSLHKPQFILEIGTSIGFSTLWLASAAAAYGGFVKTIDIDSQRLQIAEHHFKKAQLRNITTFCGDATSLIKEFHAPFDFVFLDGGKEHYLEQVLLLEKNGCIKKGTLIAADNAAIIQGKEKEKIEAYLLYVRHSGRYLSAYIPFENGLEVSHCLQRILHK